MLNSSTVKYFVLSGLISWTTKADRQTDITLTQALCIHENQEEIKLRSHFAAIHGNNILLQHAFTLLAAAAMLPTASTYSTDTSGPVANGAHLFYWQQKSCCQQCTLTLLAAAVLLSIVGTLLAAAVLLSIMCTYSICNSCPVANSMQLLYWQQLSCCQQRALTLGSSSPVANRMHLFYWLQQSCCQQHALTLLAAAVLLSITCTYSIGSSCPVVNERCLLVTPVLLIIPTSL